MARIVLIDDEVNLVATLARLLVREGHTVSTGSRFAEVDQQLRPERFDLLFSDIVMPDMDGLEVLREVVERRGCREPVVLITGQPSLETAAEAVRRGAFDYVTKPVTKDRLLEVVARGLRHVQLLRERDRARQQEMDLLRNLATLGEQASLLSHEIRTPITSLRQALHAVGETLGLGDRLLVEELIRNIARIERLLGQTLSFAKPLQLDRVRTDAGALIADAIAQAQHLPAVADLRIEREVPSPPGPLFVDRQLLGEVLVNLLRNAGEACGGYGTVRIRVENAPDAVIIDVADDGPGVEPKRRGEIFRPFHSSKDEGTGIGLAISRKIVESHGGSLDLVDGTAPGACFRIRLPSADHAT